MKTLALLVVLGTLAPFTPATARTPTNDAAAAVRRFQAGELDLNYNFPADQRDFLRMTLGADQVHVSPYLSTYYYVFDTRREPFNNPDVRKALSMAVDRETGVILRFVESIEGLVTRQADVVEFAPDAPLPPSAFQFVFPTGTTMLY